MANWTYIIVLLFGISSFANAAEDVIIDATTENISEFDQLLMLDAKTHEEFRRKEKMENLEKQNRTQDRMRIQRRIKRSLLKDRAGGQKRDGH